MIKSDLEIINRALKSEEFGLPKKQLLNNTIKINSNRNLNIASSEEICNYKLNCYSNMFDNFEIFFNSIFNVSSSKEKIFDDIKLTSRKKINFQNEVDISITEILEFYKKNSFKEEIFKTHILKKQSVNFGKITNFLFNKIFNEESLNVYSENRLIAQKQETYFEIFNQDLMSFANFKNYLLINADDVYDETNKLSNLNDVNVNTYICQNFINLTRSLFTLYPGTLHGVVTKRTVDIADTSKNLICITSEDSELKFFDYVNTESLIFDYKGFFNNEYVEWQNNRQTFERVDGETLNTSQQVPVEIENDVQTYNLGGVSYNYVTGTIEPNNPSNLEIESNVSNLETNQYIFRQKQLNISPETYGILDRSLNVNNRRYLPVPNEFYKDGAVIDKDDGSLRGRTSNTDDIPYKPIVENIIKTITDVYNSDLGSLLHLNSSFLKKWIFHQTLHDINGFSSDVVFRTNNLFQSISFDAITNKSINNYRHAPPGFQGERLNSSNILNYTSILNVSSEEEYNENLENLLYTQLRSRYRNIRDNFNYTVSLDYLNMNIERSMSMIYYKRKPIFEVYKINDYDFNNYNYYDDISQSSNNDYSIFDKDIINTRIRCNYLSLKTDNIVKKAKMLSFKNLDINLDIFKEIATSISRKSTKNLMISYSNDAESNIVLADAESKLFNLIFTKDEDKEDKFYSNFSITHNEKGLSTFSNYLELNKNNIETNSEVEDNSDLLNSILKNNYRGKFFKTSSSLLKNIVEDVIKEAFVKSELDNYFEIARCQYLYLYYIKNAASGESEKNSYSTIAKRFIKKSIEQSQQYTGFDDFKEFKYNIEDIDLNSYTDNTAHIRSQKKIEFQEKFIEELVQTSDSLNKIKNTVFDSTNLNKIKNDCSFEKTQNIKVNLKAQNSFNDLTSGDLYDENEAFTEEELLERLRGKGLFDNLFNKLDESFENSELEVAFELTKCILPFTYLFKDCVLNKTANSAANVTNMNFNVENLHLLHWPFGLSAKPEILRSFSSDKINMTYSLHGNNQINSTEKKFFN